jgi:hypothetical protein
MPFSAQYKPFIETEEAVSKSRVLPRNIYKISSYKYIDGTQKTLSGIETAYVFVLGIYDKKLSCIKISEIKPEKFFKWLKPSFKKGLTEDIINESQKLAELLILTDKPGKKMVNLLQQSSLYNANPNPYRTYTISGIKQITEIRIKKDILKKYSK